MATLADKVKGELDALVTEGVELLALKETSAQKGKAGEPKSEISQALSHTRLNMKYQEWYTKSSLIVKQIIPDRYQEFLDQYSLPRRKKLDVETYTISDYLAGLSLSQNGRDLFDRVDVYQGRVLRQVAILQSAESRINSSLSDVRRYYKHKSSMESWMLHPIYSRTAISGLLERSRALSWKDTSKEFARTTELLLPKKGQRSTTLTRH